MNVRSRLNLRRTLNSLILGLWGYWLWCCKDRGDRGQMESDGEAYDFEDCWEDFERWEG